MSDKGWITLHRKLLDKPIWLESSPEQKVILITLLLMANHKEKEWEWKGVPYKAKPGQFVTSLPSIAKKSGKGISLQNVRTALRRFEKYDFLTDESTTQNRLITIVNWGLYQSGEKEANSQTNSQLTVDQQTPNSQLTANNNVNNDNNIVVDDDKGLNFFQTYQEVFGVLNSLTAQKLNEWAEDLSPEIVNEALVRSGLNNAQTFGYTETILKVWSRSGVKTLDDVLALDAKREKANQTKKQNHSGSGKRPDNEEEPRLNTDVSF